MAIVIIGGLGGFWQERGAEALVKIHLTKDISEVWVYIFGGMII